MITIFTDNDLSDIGVQTDIGEVQPSHLRRDRLEELERGDLVIFSRENKVKVLKDRNGIANGINMPVFWLPNFLAVIDEREQKAR